MPMFRLNRWSVDTDGRPIEMVRARLPRGPDRVRDQADVIHTGPVPTTADFHPDLRRIARLAPKQVVTPVTLPVIRLVTRRMWRRVPKDVEALTLPSGVGVRLYRPTDVTGAGPALLWIHGGGYVIGHPGQDDVLCRRFAQSPRGHRCVGRLPTGA